MDKPLISCYTPTYNRADILMSRAIPSVLRQTYKNFVYIIVSDGSTDNTKKLVETIKDKRVQFYEIERQHPHHDYNSIQQWYIGGSFAANFALDKVDTDWVSRIDDDDIWTEDHLEKSLNFVIKHKFEFITSKAKGIDSPLLQDYIRIHDFNKYNPQVGPHSSWFYKGYLNTMKYNSNCYKKKWNKVEDTDLLERMFKRNIRMGYLNEELTEIFPRPGEKNIGMKAILDKKIIEELIEKESQNDKKISE